ncbi:unnamed protein product [Pylaiella littoralis]
MSRPSSRNAGRPNSAVVPARSYERPEPNRIISKHLGTVLEDGFVDVCKEELNEEQYEAAKAAFRSEAKGESRLGQTSVKQVLLSLKLRLDDALFQRLVGSRWDSESEQGPDGRGGVDFDGFARIYRNALTPAHTFGRHLRKAAGRGEEELVRELVLRGCDPNTGSGTGETALHTMASFGRVDCAKALRALCGKDLIMQPRDKAGWTPLMVAAGNGHTPFMRLLLDEGVDPGVANNSERTALHRAAARGRDKALKLLISKKAKVDGKDKCGYTGLHLAAMHDEAEAMRALLEAGADIEVKDALGYTAAHFCSDRLWTKLIEERDRGGGRGGSGYRK